jgi:DNA-binding XRE family transcriptional regulator
MHLQRARPVGRWIRAIRRALGVSTSAPGRRLELAQKSIVQLEENERTETITLASLRRVAARSTQSSSTPSFRERTFANLSPRARSCICTRCPNRSIHELESQGLNDNELQERIEELAREVERRPRELWR